jgi:hypothetical protein
VEGSEALGLVRAIGAEDQVQERRFPCRFSVLFPRLARVGVEGDEVLARVLSEVENFESAGVLAVRLEPALHADHAFARGVNGELAEIGANPLAPQFLRHRSRGARAAEEVGHKIAFAGGSVDNALQ